MSRKQAAENPADPNSLLIGSRRDEHDPEVE
jgi:hypothetical protein